MADGAGAKHRVWLGVVAACAFALLAFSELLERPSATGFGDYQFFHHSWELGRVALSRHGELPLWNPYQCGGIPEWGDPQSQLLHPLFLLSFLLGTTLALKLFVLVHAALGAGGMYLFARREEGLGSAAACLAAVAWAGSGFFGWHVGSGHAGFVAFYLLPWVLLGFRRAPADVRWAALVAGGFALALFAGGVYAFPYFALVIGFDALTQLARGVPLQRLAAALGASVIFTLILSSARLVPIVEHVIWYPRVRSHLDSVSLGELWSFLTHFDRSDDLVVQPGHIYGRVEYGAYVGLGVLALALTGALARGRARLALIAGTLVFAGFVLGDFSKLAPWSLLRRLPVFSSLQVPSRFLFAVTFFLALLAGVGLDLLADKSAQSRLVPRTRARALVPWLVAFLAALPVVAQHRSVLDGHWEHPPVVASAPGPYHLSGVAPSPKALAQYPPRAQAAAENLASGWCYTGMGYEPAAGLWPGQGPQVRLEPLGTMLAEGRAIRSAFAEVELPVGGRVLFNQTFAPGWQTSVGTLLLDHGRLAVELPPGRHRIELRYQPSSFGWALFGSLAGVLLLALFVRLREARARGLVLAVGALLAVAGLARAARPGPKAPPESHRPAITAGASDYAERGLNAWYRPEHAIDGQLDKEWLAPPGRKAWLELRLESPWPVRHLVLDNAKNPPHGDFGAKLVRVESYSNGRLVGVVSAELSEAEPSRAIVPLGGEPIDRLKISVETWRGRGGGLAEVRLF